MWVDERHPFVVSLAGADTMEPVLTVCGEIDVATVAVLANCVADVVATDPSVVVFDLTGARYLGACGVGLIATTRFKMADTSSIVLRGANAAVRRVLSVTKVDTLCTLED
jgi:anti-anti-sigma factor